MILPRYRIRYSKKGPARFVSHLDLLRTFERAMRRAGLPLAFSQGFNPHPKFSFGAPLPVGVAGEKEYMDIELSREMPPGDIEKYLGGALPAGIDLGTVFQVPDDSPAIMSLIDRACYTVRLDFYEPVDAGLFARCMEGLLALPEVYVTRTNKEGKIKKHDVRPGIFRLEGLVHGDSAVMEMEIKTGSSGNIRPEEVVQGLTGICKLPVAEYGLHITRNLLFAPGGCSLDEDSQRSKV
jgi:radical SAM-linked protein